MGQIFGAISLVSGQAPAEMRDVMSRNLDFWQADACGHYEDTKAALGCRLLYNTPEAHLEQMPLACPEDRYVLVCVARLDNREELAARLRYSPGSLAHTADSRLLLDAFLEWKADFPKHLVGDFAAAIWDKQEQTLLLVRDHMGVKPLFCVQTRDRFLFASDINAFRSLCEMKLQETYLARSVATYTNPAHETCYTNIFRLLPAHTYQLRQDNFTGSRYWTLEAAATHGLNTEEAYYTRFRELLTEAVRCRLRTPGNIGCELSGGLDSSAVTMLAARESGAASGRLHTFSFVMPDEAKAYDDQWVNEEPEQELVIEAAGIPRAQVHKLTRTHFDDPLAELDYAYEVHGGPHDTDCFWGEALRREASKHDVRVMLSGFPGDELASASGGAWFHDVLARKQYRLIASLIREKPLERLKGIKSYLKKKYLSGKYRPSPHSILDPEYGKRMKLHPDRTIYEPDTRRSLAAQVTRPHTCLRMESEGLYALRNRMETRYPLADIRLLQFVLSIPPVFHKDAPLSRHPFRQATRGILPEPVRLRQNKKGAPLIFYRFKAMYDQEVFLRELQAGRPGPAQTFVDWQKLERALRSNLTNGTADLFRTMRIVYAIMRTGNKTL